LANRTLKQALFSSGGLTPAMDAPAVLQEDNMPIPALNLPWPECWLNMVIFQKLDRRPIRGNASCRSSNATRCVAKYVSHG